jgi:hypothetical protein
METPYAAVHPHLLSNQNNSYLNCRELVIVCDKMSVLNAFFNFAIYV